MQPNSAVRRSVSSVLSSGGLRTVSAVAMLALATALAVTPSRADVAPSKEAASRAPNALTPTFPPRIASYRLEARLDENAHSVAGKGAITFTNASKEPTSELFFHLYLNAFKNEKTLFMRSPFTGSRSARMLGRPGSITVKRLSSPRFEGKNLWENAEKHTPGDPDDSTDIRVPLPAPIAPGETVIFDVEFASELPEIVERTGFSRSFHLVAQWFPKLARREENGVWAHFPFHPHAEFYADFGDYDVTLDVDKAYTVGATGKRVEARDAGNRRILRYRASGVVDFAWTAWDGFETRERTIDGVHVELLTPRGIGPAETASWDGVIHGFESLNRLFGRYPYPTLTVVYPPRFAAAAGGMEYPTFITTGGSTLLQRLGFRLVEQVTVHELGHQWFQSMVATNEAEYPFLDEGLNSYAEWTALEDAYGAGSIFQKLGLSVSIEAAGRWGGLIYGQDEAISERASEFTNMRALGGIVYTRTALSMSTIAGVYGKDKLQHALGVYAARYRFLHPTPRALLDVVRDEVSPAAERELSKMLFERGFVDYAVRDLDSRSMGQGRFKSRAVLTRHGNLTLPVKVRFTLSDGASVDRAWNGEDSTTVIELEHGAPLASVTVDPERRVALDENRLNDTRRFAPRSSSLRVSERATYFTQLLFHLLGP